MTKSAPRKLSVQVPGAPAAPKDDETATSAGDVPKDGALAEGGGAPDSAANQGETPKPDQPDTAALEAELAAMRERLKASEDAREAAEAESQALRAGQGAAKVAPVETDYSRMRAHQVDPTKIKGRVLTLDGWVVGVTPPKEK